MEEPGEQAGGRLLCAVAAAAVIGPRVFGREDRRAVLVTAALAQPWMGLGGRQRGACPSW